MSQHHILDPLLLHCQDIHRTTGVVATLVTLGDLVMHPEAYDPNDPAARKKHLASGLKVAANYGISKAELPPVSQEKLDNWLQTGNPSTKGEATVDQALDAQAEGGKKRTKKGDQEAGASKKRAVAKADRKRKQ